MFQNFHFYFIFSKKKFRKKKKSTLYLEIYTEYSASIEEKSRKFLGNFVDLISREKIKYDRTSAILEMKICGSALWPSICNPFKLKENLL